MTTRLASRIESFCRPALRPLVLLGAFLIAATAPGLASTPEGLSTTTEGSVTGRGKAPSVNARSQELRFQVVRGEGISSEVSDPPAATAAVSAGKSVRAEVPPNGAQKLLDQPQCTICLEGSASATWTGSTGSFEVDHVTNWRSTTTGPMDLRVVLTSTLPVWGQTITYRSFSDVLSLNPLSVGYQYNNVASGDVTFYGSTIPAGTYYQLLYLRENVGGSWGYVDWILFPKLVTCNGTGCTTVASCSEDLDTMCLIGGRYRVTSIWKNQYAGGTISTLHKATLTSATGAFWLSDSNTYEYLIRINTATDNGRAWIAIPTFTDVEFWILVEDLVGGQAKTYHSLPGNRTLIYDPSFFVYP
jgi:hypothetical protein